MGQAGRPRRAASLRGPALNEATARQMLRIWRLIIQTKTRVLNREATPTPSAVRRQAGTRGAGAWSATTCTARPCRTHRRPQRRPPRPGPREHELPQTPGLPAASLALASSTGGGSQPLRLLSPWREEPKSPPVGATAGLGTARRARRLTLTVGDSAACSMPTTWGTQGEGQQRHTAGTRPGGACGQTDGRGAGAAPPGPCEERAAQVSTLAAGPLRLLPPSVFDSDSGKPGCSRAPPSIAMAAALK